jgi:hypothetical protein
MMLLLDLHTSIVSSFGKLWKFKPRGETVEIITPFASTSQKFISLFLSQKGKHFIVSDGAWLSEGLYGNTFDRSIDCFEKVFSHYVHAFSINEVKNLNGGIVFYKKTDKLISIPSLVFDMANFISTTVSLTEVEYSDKEIETEHRFAKTARVYLEKIKLKKTWSEWHFNEYLDPQRKEVKPSAILRKKNSKLVLLNFVTGSDTNYFRLNIGKANMVFEMADKAKEAEYVESKIALLDDTARGYQMNHISNWLNHLLDNPKSSKVEKLEWAKRKELQTI